MTHGVQVSSDLMHGGVDEGYGPVADAFRRNFAERGEVGAACAVYRDTKKVVDLWGGFRDAETRAKWQEDTVVVMFSTAKGVSSLAIALAHSRGLLDYEERVATYWPEFAWRGKGGITVRQLLSHQAGLPVLDVPLTIEDLADLDVMAAALALQKPLWVPGTRHGYHLYTIGWYEGELLRRVDPAHRSLGRFFAEEIAGPLGLEYYIGLPAGFDHDRRATIQGYGKYKALLHMGEIPRGLALAAVNPKSLFIKTIGNPRELLLDVSLNRPDMLAVEIPAGNGVGEPRAVAAAYSAAITGELGLTSKTLDALVSPVEPPSGGPLDLVLRAPISYSLGYLKPSPEFCVFGGSANAAFGTPGKGGSFAFADLDTKIGYCYAPNRLGVALIDERDIAIRDALYVDVLKERPQNPLTGGSRHGHSRTAA